MVRGTGAWARLEGLEDRIDEVRDHLAYTDERARYALYRFTNSPKSRQGLTAEEFQRKVADLRASVKRSLLDGLRLPAGAASGLAARLGVPLREEGERRSGTGYPWHHPPDWTLRGYQDAALEALLAVGHGAVELAPGTGKTKLALSLVKRLGLPAVICSPFGAIVQQTYHEALDLFGPRRVGQYGDGKKDLARPITIATTQALYRAVGRAADFFRAKQIVIGDESHTAAADTLSKVFLGLLQDAPWRFFMTGTLLRTDGLQPLLDGIAGPSVLSMTALEAQAQGWLAPTAVRVLEVPGVGSTSSDPGRATREVLLSDRVNRTVGALVRPLAAAGRPVLILVDELPQFAALRRHLGTLDVRFAHASADAERLEAAGVPPEHRRPDVMRLVKGFNAGEYPVLVGTSAVGTGVDIRATQVGVYLRGGKSEIDVRQAAGRFMRLHPGKKDALVIDVDPVDGGLTHKHAVERTKVWRQIAPDVRGIRA